MHVASSRPQEREDLWMALTVGRLEFWETLRKTFDERSYFRGRFKE
jgi:hypothetical protein